MMNEFSWGEMDDAEFDSQFFSTLSDLKEEPPSSSLSSEHTTNPNYDSDSSNFDEPTTTAKKDPVAMARKYALENLWLQGPMYLDNLIPAETTSMLYTPSIYTTCFHHPAQSHPSSFPPTVSPPRRIANPLWLETRPSSASTTAETPSDIEQELHSLIISQTDPVGKYMKKIKLTPRDAIRFQVHELLLKAPRKVREKYGPRREIEADERILTNRERNREHAKATRTRKRIFKEIEDVLQKSGFFTMTKHLSK